MSYCTTAELINITESARSATVLQACIDEGDRKINLYLKSNGIAGSSGDDLKSVSLTMAKAELLDLGLQAGDLQASNGDFTSSLNVTEAVKALRASAYAALDQYIEANTISDSGANFRCSRVRARCH
jgi:hypothetical protein